MKVPEIDLLHPKPLQRFLKSFLHVLRGAIDVEPASRGRTLGNESELRRQENLIALPGTLEPMSFMSTASEGVSRVEHTTFQ